MLKSDLKRLLIPVLVYSAVIFIFSGFFDSAAEISETLPHQGSNTSLIVIINDCILISRYMADRNEMYRYGCLEKYFFHKVYSFSLISAVFHLALLSVNLLLTAIANTGITALSFICQIHLWMISIVIYTAVFVCTLDGKKTWLVWVIMALACLLDLLAANGIFLFRGMSLFQLYLAADVSVMSALRYTSWFAILFGFLEIRKREEL